MGTAKNAPYAPNASDAPNARERLVRSALEIASDEGLEALTTRRVAAEAGVNLGLLHYYFASKEELVQEVLLRYVMEQGEAFAGQAGGTSPEEELAALFSAALERAFRRPALVFSFVHLLSAQFSRAVARGPEGFAALQSDHAPIGRLLLVLQPVIERVKAILVSALGDEDLAARRTLQLYTSILHPILFTPLPGLVFGCDLSSPELRAAYVRGLVAGALQPAGQGRERGPGA